MPQQERKFVIDRTFSIVEICVAYATGLDSNQYFSRPRIRDQNINLFDSLSLSSCNNTFYLMQHETPCKSFLNLYDRIHGDISSDSQ